MATTTKNNAAGQPLIMLRGAAEGPLTSLNTKDVTIIGTPRRVRLQGATRDTAATSLVAVQPDEVVRVEYDNGIVLWSRADDLLRERGIKAVNRGDGGETWEIDSAPRFGRYRNDVDVPSERGILEFAIKALEFFGIQVAAGTAKLVGKTFERQRLGNEPGLYRVALAPGARLTAVVDGTKAVAADRPVLIFLHGTMSSHAGSFKDLWSTDADEAGKAAEALRGAWRSRYGDEIYTFEHRTLSQSPIQNALELAQQLPEGAQLHLVSHSRGGLVGELMCLGERDKNNDPIQADLLDQLFKTDRTVAEQIGLGPLDGDAAKARDAAYAADRKRLTDLVKLLDEKRIRVRRFVRVACPARGTTLASGRLDRWLSVINLLVPGGLFGDVADFLLAVVKERTDPRTLPGIEAMMPGSALTRLLHHPRLKTTADLSVIAGDLEATGKWGQLKLLALDWFYSSDHDLVVNTGSMVGGILRPDGGARFRRDEGDQVTHFNYFKNKKSVGWLADALAREDGSDAGFQPMAETKQEEPRWRSALRASRSVTTPRPIAVVIPGTMGSALNVKDRRVWLAYFALMKGGLGDIGVDASDVMPVDLLEDFYGPLIEHLTRTHRVEILPYDWRMSVREAANQLTARLEALLPEAERTRQPVHIVAHSMGGLVARAMIADGGAGAMAWRRLTALPGSRLLMLGTPNLGSHEAVRWLTGTNPTQAKLILLDFTRNANGVIDVVRRFPGLAELLPFDPDNGRWSQVATWRALKKELGAGWTPVDDSVLRQAASTWKLLRGATPDPQHMVYVAGCQPATVIDHEVVDEAYFFSRKRLRFIATSEGDGTVSWASGRLADVPTYYAPDTGHDQLCSNADDRRVFRGYVDLLLTGKTDQLSPTPPSRARAAGGEPDRFVLPDLPIADDIPDDAMLRSLGFGGGRARRKRAGAAPLSAPLAVSVRHGDLSYARHPVLVGHYAGDTIVSAEAALDRQMKGAQPHGPLSRRRDLGLYPGPHGTHAVFFNEESGRSPDGALVVGLGQVGELSAGRLEAGVRDVLLEYALRLLQRAALERDLTSAKGTVDKPTLSRVNASVSALLVGTGAGGLPLRDSIEAMLRGALAANRKLEDAKLDQQVLVDRVEFIELYEDAAISAAKELRVLLDNAELGGKLTWPAGVVDEGEGRRQRSTFDADPTWWQRIEITEDRKADRLRFVTIGDLARADEVISMGQLRMADRFIAQACGSAEANPNVAKTLFEMLLPNRLKERAPDQRSIVLLVDETSARFPWELLEDRWSRTGRPPAVTAGMVRQLKVSEFRSHPAYGFDNTVFVVGNPDLEGWEGFVDLPGARREGDRVRQLFEQNGFTVGAEIDASASKIVDGLHAKAWRVLHLAGHGEHEFEITETRATADQPQPVELPDGRFAMPLPEKKTASGMVIGKNMLLTPGDVEQMRHVPELVFVNCCHLGKSGGESAKFNKLAANLGVQFIRMGVRAVVCAGWAVNDAAALIFAEFFYRRMLRGDTFGRAVLDARTATWRAHPEANTWGAYQCYGDPAYRLLRDDGDQGKVNDADYCAASELVTDLRNLCESIQMSGKEKSRDESALSEGLRASIEATLTRVPSDLRKPGGWLERADVCAALGFAYGEARLFTEAVEWLDKALACKVGDCPVRAAEQSANFKVRLAAQEWAELRAAERSAGPRSDTDTDSAQTQVARAGIAERIENALYELDAINNRAPTPERQSLLGSACKRLAWVQTGRPRVEALLNMAAYYRQAFDGKQQKDAYSFTNWAVACLLLAALDPVYAKGEWRPALADLCERQIDATRKANQDDPQIWHSTGLADIQIVQLLMEPGDKARCERLAKAAAAQYEAAFARGASPREVGSIQELLDFLVEMIAAPAAWPAAARAALEAIRSAI